MRQQIPQNIKTPEDLAHYFSAVAVPQGFQWISNLSSESLVYNGNEIDAATLKSSFQKSGFDFILGAAKGGDQLTREELDAALDFLKPGGLAHLDEPSDFSPTAELIEKGMLGVYKGPKQLLET